MVKPLVLSLIFLILSFSVFAQNEKSDLNTQMNQIKAIIDSLPRSNEYNFESEYDFEFNPDDYSVRVKIHHYTKKTGKKRNDVNQYQFIFTQLDPHAILIKKDSLTGSFDIRFYIMNNKSSITQEVLIDGRRGASSTQDIMTLGSWNDPRVLADLEKLRDLSAHFILDYYDGKLPSGLNTKTESDAIIRISDGRGNVKVIDLENQGSGDIYTIVEEMPLFDGAIDQDESNKKVNNYLEKRVKSDRHYKKGTVFISFVVNQDGRTENIKILRGINDKIWWITHI